MNARSGNMNANIARKSGCGCGCAGACDCERGCALECLVRPNFFCGQFLTDADLAAMVEWMRNRLALVRYRDGWGIACGLELTCSAPGIAAASCCGDASADGGPVVYLNPGYALDCCGNDLVVCEPIRVDLGSACRPPDDLCAPPGSPQAIAAAQAQPPKNTGCLRIAPANLIAVQLSLRYGEDLMQGQRAVFRGACSNDGACEYTRVLERAGVRVEPVPLVPDASDPNAQDGWAAAFQKRLAEDLKPMRAALEKDFADILQYIRRNPPYQLCFLESAVRCLCKSATTNEKDALRDKAQLARLMLADWILRQLQCPCDVYPTGDGVPLGRVIMQRETVAGRTQCSVVMIEQGAAYRRALRKEPCRTLAATEVDLAPYLWQPSESTLKRLQDLKIDVAPDAAAVTETREALGALLDSFNRTVVTYDRQAGGEIVAHVVEDIGGTSRIAFFAKA